MYNTNHKWRIKALVTRLPFPLAVVAKTFDSSPGAILRHRDSLSEFLFDNFQFMPEVLGLYSISQTMHSESLNLPLRFKSLADHQG